MDIAAPDTEEDWFSAASDDVGTISSGRLEPSSSRDATFDSLS